MSEKDKNNKENKNIEIVTGDGKNLDISPVFDHISSDKPKSANKSKKEIIVPGKKDTKK